ncbi:FAD-binding oxidoreductase [bacterium]|nr:FAD-binding oxidoreductase [bacterium]
MAWLKKEPLRSLKKDLGKDKLLTSPEELLLYGYDATSYRGEPIAVVMAETTDDIRGAVNFARDEGYKITPRGAGSGLSGGSVPVDGGIVISCERMNSILKVDVDNQYIVVQPGVVTSIVQEAAARHKLFYPPDPSSYTISTIGGNVAENAGGLRCFKYGVTGHYVLGIEFIDAEGNLYHTGALDDKDHNPDLTPLLVGSEGTLGIFSQIALRLIRAPEETVTISAYFNDQKSVFNSIDKIISSGCVPSVLEYIDGKALTASARHIGIDFPEDAVGLLLIELDGFKAEIESALTYIKELLADITVEMNIASLESDRKRLWQLRRGISPSLIRISSGKIHEDVAVPRHRLLDLVEFIRETEDKFNLEIPFYGHAGDGNLHVVIMYDADQGGQQEKANKASQGIFKAAIDMGGTITGEHGIGYAKRQYLPWQQPDKVIELYRQIKDLLDPQGLFNPEKVLTTR